MNTEKAKELMKKALLVEGGGFVDGGYTPQEVINKMKDFIKIKDDEDELHHNNALYDALDLLEQQAAQIKAKDRIINGLTATLELRDNVISKQNAEIKRLKKWVKNHLIETCPDIDCDGNCEKCELPDKWVDEIALVKDGE